MKKKYSKAILNWFKKKKIILKENTDLFTCENVDSFLFIELLVFLESKFDIKLKTEKIFLKKKLTIFQLNNYIQESDNKKIKKK
jgi:acyl carrier protein